MASDFSDKSPDWRLQRAVLSSELGDVKAAIADGANPNYQPEGAHNLLVAALQNKQYDIVDALLLAGANPNQRSSDHNTGMTVATDSVAMHSLRLFMEFGGDPNGEWQTGEPLLHYAHRMNWRHLARILLEAGADPFVKDAEGNSPFMTTTSGPSFAHAPDDVFLAWQVYEHLPRLKDSGAITRKSLLQVQPDGYCLLDNPAVWREWDHIAKALDESGEQPLSKEDILRAGPKAQCHAVHASRANQLDKVVQYFNRHGKSLTLEELQQAPGLQGAGQSVHVARAIFTRTNTAGWDRDTYKRNRALLSKKADGAVPTIHIRSQGARSR